MAADRRVRIFTNAGGRSVKLPAKVRFSGNRVKVRKVGDGDVLASIHSDVQAWFRVIDDIGALPFMSHGRNQPPSHPAEKA